MRVFLMLLTTFAVSWSAMAQAVRMQSEYGEQFQSGLKSMRLLTAEHQVISNSAETIVQRLLPAMEGLKFTCSPVQKTVESCVITGVVKVNIPGGQQQVVHKVLMYNVVDGKTVGDIVMAH